MVFRASILLVEDDPADVFMYRKALEPHMDGPVHCESRAAGVSSALQQIQPAFVVTDLKLPGADGTSVVRMVRDAGIRRALPVIVCSTSDHPADVERSYAAGANAYVRKPRDLDGWSELARCLVCFWGGLNLLPQ
jgi:CheY-like chemotaxis protein